MTKIVVADSFLINIPFEENTDICTNTLFEDNERVEGLSKIEFKKLLSLVTRESYFIFNGKFYKQVHGVVVGLLSSLTLANAFLVYFGKNLPQKYSSDLSIITAIGLLMISLFYSFHQNILKLSDIF